MSRSAAVAQALDDVGRAAADEHRCDPALLHGYLPAVLATAGTLRRLSEAEKQECRRTGGEAARAGLALPEMVDLYMTASRRLWPRLSELVGAMRGRPVRPAELVRLGEAVWHAADDALAALAAGFIEEQRLVVRGEEAARLRFVDDLLRGKADIGSLVDRADTYGLNLAGGHIVAVAHADDAVAPTGGLTTWVEQAARSRFPGRGVLVTTDDGKLVCVVSTGTAIGVPQEGDASALAELAASAAAELIRGAGRRVAVSRRHAGPLGIARCYAEALEALHVADRLALPDPVVHASALLVYKVLLRDEGAMRELVQEVLGPLAETAEGPERLVQTLAAYFGAGGNTAAAARTLHLSVRALSYRLQRIHELTGYRPGEPAHLLPLHVAVTGAKLIGWPDRSVTVD